jgi:bacillopeptidase F (M6 metalloprotease family)
MVFGPFSLADAAAAELNFDLWLNTEQNFDVVCRLASTNGTNFSGSCTSGNTAGWIPRTLNLSSYLGQANVWIALEFYSDDSNVLAEGGYVDNVVLRKCTGAGCTTTAARAAEVGTVVESPRTKTLIQRKP